MGYSENDIWQMTPKKFFAIMSCALDFKQQSSANSGGASSGTASVRDGNVDDINW